jgi:hypothetical protein
MYRLKATKALMVLITLAFALLTIAGATGGSLVQTVSAAGTTGPYTQCNNAPFIWPTYGKRGWYIWNSTTTYVTQDGDKKHDGVDILQVNQTENVEPIYAAADGYLTWLNNWSLRMEVNVDAAYDVPEHHVYLYYTHMADNAGNVSYINPALIGAKALFVRKGQYLGKQGRKGTADELVHLHISVSRTATEAGNIDPTKYFGDVNLDASNGGTTDGAVPPFRCKSGSSTYYVGSVGGLVTNNGVGLSYSAYLNLTINGKTYSTWSAAGGAYSFDYLPVGTATIKAIDNAGNSATVNNVSIVANITKQVNVPMNTCGNALASTIKPLAAQALDCGPIVYPPTCPGGHNGLYCGSTLGLSSNTLYNCQDGSKTVAQVCSNGCSVQPAGTDDFCSPSSGGNNTCPNGQNGYYCGSSLGLDPNTLYSCQNGVKSFYQSCALGCIQKPPGTADVCRTSTSSGSCPAGNGDYCGSTLGLDPNTLFSCSNGNISVKQVCNNGCKLNPPGTADACYPPGTGGGGNTGSKLILYGDSNYGANTIRVQVGVGDTDEPNRGAAYKSMSLPAGWSVILSDQHLGQVGRSECFSQSQPNLETNNWAFSIESMRVFGTNVCPTAPADGVSICRDTGMKNCMFVGQDVPSLSNFGFGNDTLKSIQIGGSWEAVLFEDDNYGGRKYVASTNNDLGGIPFGYGASSIIVRKRDPAVVQLYHLGDYNDGNPFKTDRTIPNLDLWDGMNIPDDQKWNDRAESMRVASGYEVVLCDNSGFHGTCGRANSDHPDLNEVAGLRRRVSSIQVCQGHCAPTSVPPSLIAPANNISYAPGIPVTLSWAGNGDQYQVEYWGGAYGDTHQSTGWRDDMPSAFTLTSVPASANPYYWRVQSWTNVGDSGWSEIYSFKVQETAPTQVYISSPSQVDLNTDLQFHALVTPSNATNLQYTWSPQPKSGQGTADAVYNWTTSGIQTVSVTVQNSGGSVNAQTTVNLGCPTGQYLAEYFNNKDLSGAPVSYSCEDHIDFDWGYGGPSQLGVTDNFSVRWTAEINFPRYADYKFSTLADDGIRVYVGDDTYPAINAWVDASSYTEAIHHVDVGLNRIRVEYYENTGYAQARLSYTEVVPPSPDLAQIPGQSAYYGEHFAQISLNDYITNLNDKTGLNWSATNSDHIQVYITDGVADLVVYPYWAGSENITFTATDAYGRTASSTATFTIVGETACPAGQYALYYFNNLNLQGIAPVTKCEATINHSWGLTAPAPGITADNFSARWTRSWYVPVDGNYTFAVKSDEGVRLYVDGVLKIDHWAAHTLATDQMDAHLGWGDHTLKMEYYDKVGAATAILTITPINKPPVVGIIPGQAIYQTYQFNQIDLSKYVTDPDFATGDYTIWTAIGNKNINVTIENGIATLNYPYTWTGAEVITFKATDRFGATSSRAATFRVSAPLTCAVGQYKAQYFNNKTLLGIPAITRCESIPQYDWGGDSPLPGINPDDFSVRWTGTISFSPTGQYRFTTTSDDGVRLYVDGALVINNWTDHAWTSDRGFRRLAAGNHIVRMDYYDSGGGAVAMLAIAGPGHAPTISTIPTQAKYNYEYYPDIYLGLGGYLNEIDNDDPHSWAITSQGTMISGTIYGDYLSIYTPYNWIGEDYITVKVTDSYGLSASVKIKFTSQNPGQCIPGTGTFCVDYYPNNGMWDSPVYSTRESVISHNWGLGSPNVNVPKDYFSARWQSNRKFTAGVHKFTTNTDNGVRLYVDGQLIIDNWISHTLKSASASMYLDAGYHLVQMEYYEETGPAVAILSIY